MKTPIVDFVRRYQESGMVRFHMPGHKGAGFLGCEGFDITEVSGADELYEAGGLSRKVNGTPRPCSAPDVPFIPRRVPASASAPCCGWRCYVKLAVRR